VKEKKYNIYQPLILSLAVAIGMLIGYKSNGTINSPFLRFNSVEKSLRPAHLDNVMRLIESNYLFDPDYKEMTNSILYSLSENLDPYSAYIPPSHLNEVQNSLNARYIGLGIYSQKYYDSILIVEILKGSPAERAGLKTLEKILSINDKSVSKMTNEQISNEFEKALGKKIQITISDRNFNKKMLDIMVDSVEANTVSRQYLYSNSTLYVGLSQFSNHTYSELFELIDKYSKEKKLNHLIIDLRDNPGGYLQEVVKILDQLFDKSGFTLVETVYKDGRRDVTKTTGRNFFDIKNVSVLINNYSASGSEVMAGVIQDLDRGLVIGTPSFGKGLVQDQYDLFNGGALRLTVANYFLPTGRSIQKNIEFPNDGKSKKLYLSQDTFRSLVLNRPLISGRGVEPDIILNDTLFDNVRLFVNANEAAIINKITEYLSANPDIILKPISQLEALDFMQKENPLKNLILKHNFLDKEILTKFLKAKMIYLIFGKAKETEYLLKFDPYVQESLKKHTLKRQ
jgi:carboxyl-terminal processing protease